MSDKVIEKLCLELNGLVCSTFAAAL